jgi:MFS family permease
VLVLAPPAAALVLGDGWRAALVIGSVGLAVAATLYVAASFGVLPTLVHQAGAAARGALANVAVAIRAMAVMLALLLFLALSQETWRALGLLAGWRFGTVLGLFGALAVVIILGGLRRERGALLAPRTGPGLAAIAEDTPAAPLVARAPAGEAPRLGRLGRLNLTLALLVALGLRVLVVGAAVGFGFLVFATLIVDRQLTAEWIGETPVVYASLDVAGGQLVLSEAALRVATLLGGFAAVYFTSVAVGDPVNREEFLGDELDRMRHAMAAWAYYRVTDDDRA